MRKPERSSLLLLVLLLGIFACEVPTVTIVDPSAQATSLALTVQVIVAATQQAFGMTTAPTALSPAASYTPVSPTWTFVPTLSPTATPTAVVLPTVTPLEPQLTVSVPTNCRVGPGKVFDMVGALLVGEVAQVYGRDPTGTYWYIRNPDAGTGYCWVWGQYATVTGPMASVPILTPMPTPSPTATATPSPDFDAIYQGLISCSPEWWPEISLENTGAIIFRSVEIILKDTLTSESASDLTDGFVDRPDCSSSHSRGTLLPGKNVVISAPALSADPAGHKLRLTITLCSSTGQNGMCITRSITFKP